MRAAVLVSMCFAAALAAEEIPKRTNFVPDPASVQRSGKGYRYPQCGWIVVHLEGAPYERGHQYGQLLAGEIAEFLGALGKYYSPRGATGTCGKCRKRCSCKSTTSNGARK
jgi:hypothetical protein